MQSTNSKVSRSSPRRGVQVNAHELVHPDANHGWCSIKIIKYLQTWHKISMCVCMFYSSYIELNYILSANIGKCHRTWSIWNTKHNIPLAGDLWCLHLYTTPYCPVETPIPMCLAYQGVTHNLFCSGRTLGQVGMDFGISNISRGEWTTHMCHTLPTLSKSSSVTRRVLFLPELNNREIGDSWKVWRSLMVGSFLHCPAENVYVCPWSVSEASSCSFDIVYTICA